MWKKLDKKMVLDLYEKGSLIHFHAYNYECDEFKFIKGQLPVVDNIYVENQPSKDLLPIEQLLDMFGYMDIKAGRVDIFEDTFN